jgi:ribosomal-protein-alanine N-acetyltransferase
MNKNFSIETNNLKLRLLVQCDSQAVMEMSQEPSSRLWLSNQVCENLKKANDLLKWLISEYKKVTNPLINAFVLGIQCKDTESLIGHVGLSPFKNSIEIGYGIAETHQGKGFATEAVLAMTNWGLTEGGLTSILGLVDSKNIKSCRVLEKAKYSLKGVYPGSKYGKKNNCCFYRKDR